MSGFDDAGDVAVARGVLDFGRHQIDVVHDVGAGQALAASARAAAARRSRRQAIRGAGRGGRRRKLRVEIGSELQVLMEQRRAACQFLRRVVFQDASG